MQREEGISVIVCSRNVKKSIFLRKNIEETIGCDYEFISIDNSQNNFSIFEAYNLSSLKSVYPFLVFIHEDIIIHSVNWGKTLLDLFKEHSQYGLIGVAGSREKTKMPSAWWQSNDNVWRIIQHFKYKPKEYWEHGLNGKELIEVAIIDGVFMAMRKDSKINFDERLKGFHNYDLSISLLNRIHDKKIGVTGKILIEHFSEGNLDQSWYESTSEFHRLYKKSLPVQVENDPSSILELKKKEVTLGLNFINQLINRNLTKEAFYWWWQLFKLKPVSKYHFRILNRLLS
ncbi:glycosyltransferase [Salinimicrobium sp. WS361]|uniref:glycosyltransferase n=1 Tax=Salinimicrobium sp. WS361 TaxID=3425123 RepID=UPI003D6F2E5D